MASVADTALNHHSLTHSPIRYRFPRHIPFYTEGSKDTERVSVAAVLINHSYGHRIQDHRSIFTAEARAILLALECIEHSNRKTFLIFTDSMSCLQALKIDHPIHKVMSLIYFVLNNKKISSLPFPLLLSSCLLSSTRSSSSVSSAVWPPPGTPTF